MQRQPISFVLLIVLLLFTGSCGRFYLSVAKFGTEKVTRLENTESEQTVLLVPMVHIAQPEFYSEVRLYLDSLKREGFVVFYEGVRSPEIRSSADSMRVDTLQRKLRRVLGLNVNGYGDKNNKSHKKWWSEGGRVGQTTDILGLNTEQDIWTDMYLDSLLYAYETRYGKIKLTECDFKTGLYEKYRCKSDRTYKQYPLTQTIRNEHIVKSVQDSEHKKIVILYGKAHMFKLMLMLDGFMPVEVINESKQMRKRGQIK